MATAFQATAFQDNAFQIDAVAAAATVGGHWLPDAKTIKRTIRNIQRQEELERQKELDRQADRHQIEALIRQAFEPAPEPVQPTIAPVEMPAPALDVELQLAIANHLFALAEEDDIECLLLAA